MTAPTLSQVKKHLQHLVAFDTTNPPRKIQQSGIVEYLSENLPGATVTVTDHGEGSVNILATKGNPRYLFNYHIDTVPVTEGWQSEPFSILEQNDKLYGLGACDIKGAAACMLACIEAGADDYAVLFSSDEEHGSSLCIRSFLEEKHDYLGVIVAEPTEAKAVLAHRGIITANLTLSAESGHSSEPRALKDNSNHQAAHWISRAICWAEDKLADTYDGLSGTCFNVGHIEGGVKPNVISPKTNIRFGLRPLPEVDTKSLMSELLYYTGIKDEQVSLGFNAPSLPKEGGAEENSILAETLGFEIGAPVNFWTEAALFSAAGFPSIVFGPGSIEQAHTANEWVSVNQLDQVVRQYWRILGHE
ncbi:acetylornithine deacetylase [Kangiella sediminilitoris]|uniref:N-acetyl-L-citrulline deacetylase n=1 Tax=Kangiella sediminilitoris TaxID=1144748 RepID=A0A1B3BCX3_9GAMM|nr:acetylornithine deacetylase [Kangiella sediminilitoris]AOE50608.1 Peptidase M20 [Kangiella sediminilitoris]